MAAYRHSVLGALVLGATLLGLGACHRTFSAKVSQPNPLAQPLDTLKITEELTIVTGDMDLVRPRSTRVQGQVLPAKHARYPLQNKARFTVVSRDRLRFHVQIEHKWEDYTDISTWKATLTDDRGNRYRPTGIDTIKSKLLVETWDIETRTAKRNRFGDIVQINDDSYKNRRPLGSLAVYRGRGDFVFYRRDIFSPEVKSMTLELERSGITFRYTWIFDEPASEAPGATLASTTPGL